MMDSTSNNSSNEDNNNNNNNTSRNKQNLRPEAKYQTSFKQQQTPTQRMKSTNAKWFTYEVSENEQKLKRKNIEQTEMVHHTRATSSNSIQNTPPDINNTNIQPKSHTNAIPSSHREPIPDPIPIQPNHSNTTPNDTSDKQELERKKKNLERISIRNLIN
jgi:hypothetical protein